MLAAALALLVPASAAAQTSVLRVEGLAVNGMAAHEAVESAIVEPDSLLFAWRVGCAAEKADSGDACRGARASAYRLVVKRGAGDEAGDEAVVYDSGRVQSVATEHALAHPTALPPDTRFHFEVTVHPDEEGTASGTFRTLATARGAFQTALRSDSSDDWLGAKWIAGFTQARAGFAVRAGATVASATAYASGLGCFELTLNGQRVADSMMDPGWSTIPPMRLLYRAYDVSSLLKPGDNAAGVRLGFCHYGYVDQAFCVEGHAMRDTCRGFVMRLSIKYSDGKTQDVLTTADGSGGATWSGTVQ